ncbi:hypothetical protein LguiA_034001 [Lonicera macranthoides]
MDDEELHFDQSSMPLLSRVDRLDSLLRYIEGKEEMGKWRSIHKSHSTISTSSSSSISLGNTKNLEVAVNEAHSKGSLMDRVLSLEDRLIRLCLEMESSKTSPTSAIPTSFGPSSSSYGFKREPISSYPIFNKPQSHINGYEFQRKPNRLQLQKNVNDNQGAVRKQFGENRGHHEKTCKSGKRRKISWPHLKLLGC